MYSVDVFTCLKKNDKVVEIFRRELELPFVPTIGMSFAKGTSTEIWEPVYFHGKGKLPVVERVFWSLDDEKFVVRLTDVEEELHSAFWSKCESKPKLRYFNCYIENTSIVGLD